jgi:hypothetical protein
MGETTDQIENHIETKREDLQSNLKELENRVKSATDWRQYFRKHTGTMVAAAFGGGVVVSAMLGKRRGAGPSPLASSNARPAARARTRYWKPGTRSRRLWSESRPRNSKEC